MTGGIDTRENGERVINLYLPFDYEGARITEVTLKPATFDLTLRWQAGEFQNSFALLVFMTRTDAEVLREVRYPDVDRILEQFMGMLPQEVRNSIMDGVVPRRQFGPADQEFDQVDRPAPEPVFEPPLPDLDLDPIVEPPAADQTGIGFEGLTEAEPPRPT